MAAAKKHGSMRVSRQAYKALLAAGAVMIDNLAKKIKCNSRQVSDHYQSEKACRRQLHIPPVIVRAMLKFFG